MTQCTPCRTGHWQGFNFPARQSTKVTSRSRRTRTCRQHGGLVRMIRLTATQCYRNHGNSGKKERQLGSKQQKRHFFWVNCHNGIRLDSKHATVTRRIKECDVWIFLRQRILPLQFVNHFSNWKGKFQLRGGPRPKTWNHVLVQEYQSSLHWRR